VSDTKPAKHPGGRPTDYNDEVAARLLAAISEGKSVNVLCKEDWAPCRHTFFVWLQRHKEFADNYAVAKDQCAESLADEIIDIADDGTNDWIAEHGDENAQEAYRFNGEHYQRSRLRVDARKWIASKLKPKKYGERTQLEHSGSIAPTADPQVIADQLVTMANSHPTYRPTLVQWASDLLKRLQETT